MLYNINKTSTIMMYKYTTRYAAHTYLCINNRNNPYVYV